jgi:universal stress protein E
MYTSTDWHLIRECPAPVLIVAEKQWNRTRSVLATVDLGTRKQQKQMLNHKVVEQAKLLSRALDAPLNIVCAIEVPTLLADMDLVDVRQYVKEQKKAMAPHLQELALAHSLPRSAFRCKKGPVSKVIGSEAARVRAQLVVMGTIGRRGVKARLIGNTAEAVLRHLRTDILAIKP